MHHRLRATSTTTIDGLSPGPGLDTGVIVLDSSSQNFVTLCSHNTPNCLLLAP